MDVTLVGSVGKFILLRHIARKGEGPYLSRGLSMRITESLNSERPKSEPNKRVKVEVIFKLDLRETGAGVF